jgi:uncharacterized protein involved in tolerance to divalent cations
MILFNIIQKDEKKAELISSFLIQKQYALQTHIDVNSILTAKGKKKTVRLFFLTKALLYNSIEKEIKENFFSDDLIIYATPISHINEEFGETLRTNLKAV